ncbi:Ferrous iron transport protein B, partial [hydrothermal vent metagenome]
MNCGKEKDQGGTYSKKVVLVGNPNVGKSVIFGAFTGRYATVSNYPGTTVEVSRGVVTLKGEKTLLIDSPGTNTLVPTSEDEVVTRDILINEKIDCALQVMDTKNIRRGLLVTLQLAEMDIPVGVSLNMYDEAGEKGFEIDVEKLKGILGTEVVPTIATQRWGLDKLKATPSLSCNIAELVTYPAPIDKAAREVEALLPATVSSGRAISLMLVAGDDTMEGWVKKNLDAAAVKEVSAIVSALQGRYSEPVGFVINKLRLARVDKIVDEVVTMTPVKGGVISEFIGKWSMHPVGGLFILLGVLFVMYEFVGVLGAGYF